MFQNEHVECEEPFELLIPHSCKTVEDKKKEKASVLNQYNHDLNAVTVNNTIEEEAPIEIIQNLKLSSEKVITRYPINSFRL